MKKLGFGLMRLPLLDPKDDGSIDIETMQRMVDAFLERGFTYFDTAWMYCGFKSEDAVKLTLTGRHPRDSYTLADKLHSAFFDTLEGRDEIFNEQLRKTGAGYFDYYLLHSVETGNIEKYEKLDCFAWLAEKKAKGLARHIGFSFHATPELLDEVLTRHPEMEFVQLQLNYLDWDSASVQSRACYEVCVKHGKPVVVMEPVKGGTLAKLPDGAQALLKNHDPRASMASWAVRFAASLPNVMVVLSGMSTLEQIMENTGFMQEFKPLTERENALLAQAADIIRGRIAVPCTGCSYCTEGCPCHIAIPKYFNLYNEQMRMEDPHSWSSNFTLYEQLGAQGGTPADCISCGQCEGVCPQHLHVIRHLRQVKALFGQ